MHIFYTELRLKLHTRSVNNFYVDKHILVRFN